MSNLDASLKAFISAINKSTSTLFSLAKFLALLIALSDMSKAVTSYPH